MKKNLIRVIIFAILIFAFGFSYTYLLPKTPEVEYKTFYNEMQEGKIANVVIDSNKITFTYTGGKSKFRTQNPNSATLKEQLLLNGISVKEEKTETEIISIALDILFYAIFFVAIIFAFRRFISPNTFKTIHKTGVTFKDVVGMEELKTDLKEIVKILKSPNEYAKKGIRLPKGILLEGAPGNGKTLLARAIAGESNVNFIAAKATDFESMFMAIGPAKVKLLFRKARKKSPCIVFIDEFDGIGTKRNYSGSAIETENTRIVTALLNELDGFVQNNGILVIAATNSREALDEALIRPGRFDAKYTVPYPDYESRILLIEKYTQNKNPDSSIKKEDLARLFNGFSAAVIESVLNRAAIISAQENKSDFGIQDIKKALGNL